MLKLENLNIGYGSKSIISNINLVFETNKIYGLIGRNGAGKSTFLRTIARLQSELNGVISFNNIEVNNKDYFDLPLTFIGDEYAFFQDLTMYEQLIFLCKLNKMSKREAKEKISTIISRFHLEEYMNYYPHACSRGTIQRFGLICGYLRNSDILLLDEPFITLDPVQVNILENALLDYKDERKIMIISSHDLDSLERICDEFLIIHDQQITLFSKETMDLENITKLLSDAYD